MYQCAIDGIERFSANVIIIENAPALYTTKGEKVAADLVKIAHDKNYSISFYKTSTEYHGIPQRRIRTFALLWNNKFAPIMNYYKRDTLNFSDFLDTINKNSEQYENIINNKLLDNIYYNFLKFKFNTDPREFVNTGTCLNFIMKNNLITECNEWAIANNIDNRCVEHVIKKLSIGLGFWDNSVTIPREICASVIGRNLIDYIHPSENRSLNIREAISLMGMPENFCLLNIKKVNHIAQNVPSCTARDITFEAIKFLNNELEISQSNFIKQNNIKERVDYIEKLVPSLCNFFVDNV
jgi:site-specific DNA-cytosine methylase